MINIPLLKTISETPGAPGFEQPIRAMVIEAVTPLVDEVRVDAMGNVFAIRKGTGDKRVMIGAHLDEIGFIVTHIDDDGFVRFHTLGGFDPKTLTAQRVIIHGKEDVIGVMGSKPVHLMSAAEKGKNIQTKDFFIDTGRTKAELDELIGIGDSITRERELIKMGHCVNGKSLDNRVSVFILLETFRELQGIEVPYDIYGVFTVQEEIGIRGASVAAQQVDPHFGFGLDVTIAFDIPGAAPHEYVTRLNKGAAIKVMDSSIVCDYRMVAFMKQTATKHDIPWQLEVLTAGGTDTAGIQRRGKHGAISGAISIPTRHIHQVIETASIADIRACIDLLKQCLLELHQYDWSFK